MEKCDSVAYFLVRTISNLNSRLPHLFPLLFIRFITNGNVIEIVLLEHNLIIFRVSFSPMNNIYVKL